MYIFNLVISPDSIVNTLPSHGLQRVVDVWNRDPAAAEYVREKRLISEVVIRGGGSSKLVGDLIVDRLRRIHDLQASISHTMARSG